MEPMGAFSSGEWDQLFSDEDLDLVQRVLDQHPSANQLFAEGNADQILGMYDAMFGSAFITPNPNFLNCSSQDSSYYYSGSNMACGFHVHIPAIANPNVDQGYTCYPMPNDYNGIVMGDNSLDQIQPPGDYQAVPVPAAEKSQLKRKPKAAISDLSTMEDDSNGKHKNPKKKPRVSSYKCNKNSHPKSDLNEAYESNGRQEGQISGMCSSEDELNGEQVSAPNWDGKPSRANRGAATDPQSLYARKRRERINERLKVLQNLVPNGTKVDISTMLEEAVQYVKFLQLQIKLLSSDDMWMYAPIAYNAMDIGLNQILHRQL